MSDSPVVLGLSGKRTYWEHRTLRTKIGLSGMKSVLSGNSSVCDLSRFIQEQQRQSNARRTKESLLHGTLRGLPTLSVMNPCGLFTLQSYLGHRGSSLALSQPAPVFFFFLLLPATSVRCGRSSSDERSTPCMHALLAALRRYG